MSARSPRGGDRKLALQLHTLGGEADARADRSALAEARRQEGLAVFEEASVAGVSKGGEQLANLLLAPLAPASIFGKARRRIFLLLVARFFEGWCCRRGGQCARAWLGNLGGGAAPPRDLVVAEVFVVEDLAEEKFQDIRVIQLTTTPAPYAGCFRGYENKGGLHETRSFPRSSRRPHSLCRIQPFTPRQTFSFSTSFNNTSNRTSSSRATASGSLRPGHKRNPTPRNLLVAPPRHHPRARVRTTKMHVVAVPLAASPGSLRRGGGTSQALSIPSHRSSSSTGKKTLQPTT